MSGDSEVKDNVTFSSDAKTTVMGGVTAGGVVQAVRVDSDGAFSVAATVDTTGLATTAKQDTIIGHVDGIEASLTTINGNVTDIETLATTISGNIIDIEALATTISGNVDGLETLIGTTNTNTGSSATSLAIMDDWDETDRCKVNIIAGQAGISATAGAVASNTPRFTLASDDPAVVSLALLDDAVATSGSAITAKGLAASGTDGTNARVLKTNTTGQLETEGTVAHDGVGTAVKPHMIAARAVGTAPAIVAADDVCFLTATTDGRLITCPFGSPFAQRYGHEATSTSTGAVSTLAAPGAGSRLCVHEISCTFGEGTGVVTVKNGVSGAAIREIRPPGNAAGTTQLTFPGGMYLDDNAALEIVRSGTMAVGTSISCTAKIIKL